MSTTSRASRLAVAAVVLVLVVTGVLQLTRDDDRTVTAYFASAGALYVGNPVEVLGVPVGTIASITPEPGRVEVVMTLDEDVVLPADVSALQVSPSLISGRSVALEPVYTSGPALADDAVIPIERTQVPLDVNDLYRNADDLADALGPDGANRDGSLDRALDVLAENLDGNGEALATMIEELSGATGTLSGARDDLTGTIGGLQTFVSTLAENDDAVRLLNQQLATVTGFLADDRGELGAALDELSTALGVVADFVADNRRLVRTNVDQLSRTTAVLVRQRRVLGEVLDQAPTGLGNLLNSYDAAGGTLDVRLDVNELRLAPAALVCELINRGTPGSLPDTLTDTCLALSDALDAADLPSIADLVAAAQGGPTSRDGD
jgi:virulence factor Mce-like protein